MKLWQSSGPFIIKHIKTGGKREDCSEKQGYCCTFLKARVG